MAKQTTAIELQRADEIRSLHYEIASLFTTALEKSIRVGELLTQQKAELKHGQFGVWVEENLPFKQSAANQYMQFFRNRELIAGATNITEARALLSPSKSHGRRNLTIQEQPQIEQYRPTKAEQSRIARYIEQLGLSEQQAMRIIENDAMEKQQRKQRKAEKAPAKAVSKERLSVTITHRDKAALARLAKQQDTSIAEWFRSLLGKELSKQTKGTK